MKPCLYKIHVDVSLDFIMSHNFTCYTQFYAKPSFSEVSDMQDPKLYNWAGAGGNQVLGFKNLNVIEKQFLLRKKKSCFLSQFSYCMAGL